MIDFQLRLIASNTLKYFCGKKSQRHRQTLLKGNVIQKRSPMFALHFSEWEILRTFRDGWKWQDKNGIKLLSFYQHKDDDNILKIYALSSASLRSYYDDLTKCKYFLFCFATLYTEGSCVRSCFITQKHLYQFSRNHSNVCFDKKEKDVSTEHPDLRLWVRVSWFLNFIYF